MAQSTATQDELRVVQRIGRLSLWWASLLTIVVATTANLIVSTLARALLPIAPTFLPLMWQAVVIFTVVGVALACAVYAMVRRFAHEAVRIYTVIAAVAMVLSLIPDALILGDPVAFEFDTTIPSVWVMMGLHCVAAIVSIAMLTHLAPPTSHLS